MVRSFWPFIYSIQISTNRRTPKESLWPIRSRPETSQITFLQNSKEWEKEIKKISLILFLIIIRDYFFVNNKWITCSETMSFFAVEPWALLWHILPGTILINIVKTVFVLKRISFQEQKSRTILSISSALNIKNTLEYKKKIRNST